MQHNIQKSRKCNIILLNTNFTHNFQEPLCADDRMVQHEYPLLLRLKCTGPLSLLQDYLQSNIRPLSAKIYMERLTQLLAYGLITASVCWWIWNQARVIHTFDVIGRRTTTKMLRSNSQALMEPVDIVKEPTFIIYMRLSCGLSARSKCA